MCIRIRALVYTHAQIQASFLNLTTSDHVWILPSYYNPDWWKGGDQHTGNCTDEDMMDILNSVIFIDPVKYPPMVRKANYMYMYSDCNYVRVCVSGYYAVGVLPSTVEQDKRIVLRN